MAKGQSKSKAQQNYELRVMEEALRVSASAFIVAHNHPSGQPIPSPADERTTQDLKQANAYLEAMIPGTKPISNGN